ncbi:aminotransferase class V-fold PLP-dependent enzyme [Sphingomonas sp.]|uniref:aminotransferase class V-fold PLP-dependent enzyme n=1 Tax=Sphingomonas sp. TaxID=28214 RepID=UPI003FA7700B
MHRVDRRSILAGSLVLPALGLSSGAWAMDDDPFWRSIAAQFTPPTDVIQLENGNWGMMPRPVFEAYQAQLARVNRDTSFYARRGLTKDLMAVRDRAAASMGVAPDELVLTRNATEALETLILGYNRLQPGDAVLIADLDYDSAQACMASLVRTRGVQLVKIDLPEPATRQAVIDAYAAALAANPRLKLILLTHLSHRTGLVLPVREIAALARAKGADVIVDAAHSWCQLDFAVPDLDCDFVAVNGHKWLGAPLGVGFLHVRKAALGKIDRHPANAAGGPDTLFSKVHLGTYDFAASMTVPTALAFQQAIGSTRRAERLRALRDRWVMRARQIDGIEVLTPDDPASHGAITSFRVRGVVTSEANARLAARLLDQHRIFTVHRDGIAGGACVRVTPALFNSMADMDRLAEALPDLVRFARG